MSQQQPSSSVPLPKPIPKPRARARSDPTPLMPVVEGKPKPPVRSNSAEELTTYSSSVPLPKPIPKPGARARSDPTPLMPVAEGKPKPSVRSNSAKELTTYSSSVPLPKPIPKPGARARSDPTPLMPVAEGKPKPPVRSNSAKELTTYSSSVPLPKPIPKPRTRARSDPTPPMPVAEGKSKPPVRSNSAEELTTNRLQETAFTTLSQPHFRRTSLDPRTFENWEYSAESEYFVPAESVRARQPSIAREAHADTSAQIRTASPILSQHHFHPTRLHPRTPEVEGSPIARQSSIAHEAHADTSATSLVPKPLRHRKRGHSATRRRLTQIRHPSSASDPHVPEDTRAKGQADTSATRHPTRIDLPHGVSYLEALITLPQPRFRPTGLDPRTFEKEYSAESGYSVPMRARQPSIAREAHADTSATRRPAQIRTASPILSQSCSLPAHLDPRNPEVEGSPFARQSSIAHEAHVDTSATSFVPKPLRFRQKRGHSATIRHPSRASDPHVPEAFPTFTSSSSHPHLHPARLAPWSRRRPTQIRHPSSTSDPHVPEGSIAHEAQADTSATRRPTRIDHPRGASHLGALTIPSQFRLSPTGLDPRTFEDEDSALGDDAFATLSQPRFRRTRMDPRTFEKEYSAESGYFGLMRARQLSIAREAPADTSATRCPTCARMTNTPSSPILSQHHFHPTRLHPRTPEVEGSPFARQSSIPHEAHADTSATSFVPKPLRFFGKRGLSATIRHPSSTSDPHVPEVPQPSHHRHTSYNFDVSPLGSPTTPRSPELSSGAVLHDEEDLYVWPRYYQIESTQQSADRGSPFTTMENRFRPFSLSGLRGVDKIIDEIEFVLTNEARTYTCTWKDSGFKLHTPHGALPAGAVPCRINVKASLTGQFEFPENSELVSPVYWISTPKNLRFSRPLTVVFQHCCTVEERDYSDLSFVVAKCTQPDLPYKFKFLDGGYFAPNSSYGSISVTHFSALAIVSKQRKRLSYCARTYVTHKGRDHWRIHFVIVRDLDIVLKAVDAHYSFARRDVALRIVFKQSEISLGIPKKGKLKKGWRIVPLSYPSISRRDADDFCIGQWIPACELIVEWERSGQCPVRLRHQVPLIGAKAPKNYFIIAIDPEWEEKKVELLPLEYPEYANPDLRVRYPAGLEEEPELCDLMNEVAAKIPNKWKQFGIELQLTHNELESYLGTSQERFSSMFMVWKDRMSREPYSWQTVVESLRTLAVGEHRLALELSKKLTRTR